MSNLLPPDELVSRFNANYEKYTSPHYNETEVRAQFVDPFFESLGWDVRNQQGRFEVSLETRVQVEEAGRYVPKRPDYGFSIQNQTRFFVETKKPSVNLRSDPLPAFQLRRYGWSAKLPVSILTDFQELIIYDCRVQPNRDDAVQKGRLAYYTYDNYVERWDEIVGLISREAVLNNNLETWVQKTKQRGTVTVDDAFLNEMETWRRRLAEDIAIHNPSLTQRELNMAVQTTIDRIVFLRICEDRGVEPYGRLEDFAKGRQVYDNLAQLFRQADAKYNSGLFHFNDEKGREEPDTLTLNLKIGDDTLQSIIARLYNDSPYSFSVIPADILGQVYERFLGKVIELTPNGATVVEKPEVRKAGGIYYTPTYIVDYIVQNTIGTLVEGKAPDEVAKLKILDPACGSGSFLIGAYQYLLDWHLKWYITNGAAKYIGKRFFQVATLREVRNVTGVSYALTTAEKKRILVNNIYGVDLDQQAVEVTKLSLLLKVLEGETAATAQPELLAERVLPDLGDNIKWGNSLIGPDFYVGKQISMFDEEETYRIKVFDWQSKTDGFGAIMAAGGFDAVIGNPPYGALISADQTAYYRNDYATAIASLDTFALFMEKAFNLLHPFGLFGMIVPSGWVSAPATRQLRQIFVSQFKPMAFASMPYDVFVNAYIDTVIVVGEKLEMGKTLRDFSNVPVRLFPFPPRYKIQSVQDFELFLKISDAVQWLDEKDSQFLITASDPERDLIARIKSNHGQFSDVADIQRGVTPFNLTSEKPETNPAKGFNGTVRRYTITQEDKKYIQYDETLAEYKPARYFSGPRLLLRELISRQFQLQATFVDEGFITNKSMQSILLNDKRYQINYLLGLLNSKIQSWYFLSTSSVARRDDFPKIVLKQMRELPFRTIDFNDPTDKARHDKMVELVQAMLGLHKQLPTAASPQIRHTIQAVIDQTDSEIDALVYELYGLDDNEIAIVESR